MADDPRLEDLCLDWELAQARGEYVTPQQLCRDCPELLNQLVQRIDKLRTLGGVLKLSNYANRPAAGTGPEGGTPSESFWKELERRAAARQVPAPPGYEVLAELDRGGMGVVYKARQLGLDRLVALKMILAGPQARPQDLTRFNTEARAVARLQHPNIVQIHDIGTTDGHAYLVLEYLEGGDLDATLRGKPLPPEQAAALVETLARAVHHAHLNGIIHRDIKPSNVLLTSRRTLPDGRLELFVPKLADFGLARLIGDGVRLTRTGVVIGTPAYMAPEQASGQNKLIGPATDIHGLGTLLYQLLTGGPPFEGSTDFETADQVLSKIPEPPSKRMPGVPPALDAICARCLEKQPSDRYLSAEHLADELKRFLAGVPVMAPPPPPPGRVTHQLQASAASAASPDISRRLWLAAIGGLVAAGVGYYITSRWLKKPKPVDEP
jgi:serine/threonine protein kinase